MVKNSFVVLALLDGVSIGSLGCGDTDLPADREPISSRQFALDPACSQDTSVTIPGSTSSNNYYLDCDYYSVAFNNPANTTVSFSARPTNTPTSQSTCEDTGVQAYLFGKKQFVCEDAPIWCYSYTLIDSFTVYGTWLFGQCVYLGTSFTEPSQSGWSQYNAGFRVEARSWLQDYPWVGNQWPVGVTITGSGS
jgi:hypothetical protein